MKTVNKLMWAVDLKEDLSSSTEMVQHLARKSGSEVIILHILDKEIEGSSIRVHIEESVYRKLSQLASELGRSSGPGTQIRVEFGNTMEMILEVAKDEAVNSIFINKKGGP